MSGNNVGPMLQEFDSLVKRMLHCVKLFYDPCDSSAISPFRDMLEERLNRVLNDFVEREFRNDLKNEIVISDDELETTKAVATSSDVFVLNFERFEPSVDSDREVDSGNQISVEQTFANEEILTGAMETVFVSPIDFQSEVVIQESDVSNPPSNRQAADDDSNSIENDIETTFNLLEPIQRRMSQSSEDSDKRSTVKQRKKNDSNQNFKCLYCHRDYCNKGNLNKHLLLHKEKMNNQCSSCGLRFICITHFKKHTCVN